MLNDTPVGSPDAVILNVSEQVLVNEPTTLVIAVEIVTVCDCGPEVSEPEIVQDEAVAAITLITPDTVAEAVVSLVGANIASIE